MNIILIGFMGSGKSAVGQRLAQELGFKFIDTDELIEQAGKSSISEIFKNKGEAYFRDLESKVLESLRNNTSCVIATGGGMVLREGNVTILKQLGQVVLLWAEPGVVFERVRQESQRPLLKVADPRLEINKILEQREPIYRRVANFIIDTSALSVADVVRSIIAYVQN